MTDPVPLPVPPIGHREVHWTVPVVDAASVRRALGAADTTAQRALSQLTEAGVLQERTGATRGRIWQHEGILAVLDEYAAAIRRPG